ncbi:ATP-binding cassette domain-containing protein [Pelomonas sp. CA6]|uniref:ATP-binding cassette domain-containing protein n=1 Tax=Pelomonas sp. CA6 TaxID=2907999 RepID=UPI001F4C3CA8|nr:ATP-binding cassette domain-containing protein [Pelomonas sp. CA6]MCH7344773.1 ATP-binding cassette domain-containing protein [Pelomonas sp. CA6]
MLAGLWDIVRAWRGRTLLALALLILAKVSAVGVPLLLKAIIDGLTGSPAPVRIGAADPASWLGVPAALLLAYALLRYCGTLFTELRDLVFARVTKHTVAAFSERAFGQLLTMSARFHAQRNTGALVREVERGTEGVGFLLGAGVFTVLPTLVEFGAVLLVIAWGYSLGFVAIILLCLLAYAAYTAAMTRQRVQRQRLMNEFDTRAHGLLVDTLLNYDTVKAHGREQAERQRYAGVLSQWVDGSVDSQRALSRLHLGQGGLIALGVAGVMLLAGHETLAGRMSVGDLVLVNAYLIQVFLPLNTLGFVFRETRDALLNTERLMDLLAQQAEIQDSPHAQPLRDSHVPIRFEHVDFGYQPERPILSDLSLEIPAGQTLAVVGSSGSGKSTLARLLLRLYDVQHGRILLGAQDLREIQLDSLREAIGLVPQDPVLFNDSIAYNIAYGRPGATRAQIVEAARAAQADEFISALPEGYDTVVGERGVRLSGGERQRIAIARAFLKNPPIIVLDEATSALDTRAERAIQGALEHIAQNRSALVIAHRLSTIVNADEIIVLDRGRIVERGRHQALLERQGLYAQLWELQRQQQQYERLERRLSLHPVNLAGLLVLTLDGMREQLAAQDIALYTDIDLGVAHIMGDAGRLARVVQLLCHQALANAAPGGRMEARLRREPLASRLSVGFHGGFLDPDAAPPDTLELRGLVQDSEGRLTVQRDLQTGDQRFQLDLPLPALAPAPAPLPAAATVAPTAEEPPTALPPQPLLGLHLLCVDDDEDALQSLALLLQQDGARVQGLGSGHEALAWLRAAAAEDWPDVLVCDIALGDEDGYAVLRSIRQLEAQRAVPLAQRLPALALTGMAQPEDRLRALLAGFQLHLAKPVPPQALVRALRQLARRGAEPGAAPP